MRVPSAMRIPVPPHAADMPGRRALADMRRTGALRHAECIASRKAQQRPAMSCAMSGAPRSSARAPYQAHRARLLRVPYQAHRARLPTRHFQRTALICALRHVKRTTLICALRCAPFPTHRARLRHAPCPTHRVHLRRAPRPTYRVRLHCAPDQEYRVYLHRTHTYPHWPCTCIAANTAAAEL